MSIQTGQLLTLAFILAVTALVVGYDIAIIRCCGPEASISRVTVYWLNRWPILAPILIFWLGVLVGHIGLPATGR